MGESAPLFLTALSLSFLTGQRVLSALPIPTLGLCSPHFHPVKTTLPLLPLASLKRGGGNLKKDEPEHAVLLRQAPSHF